jgi:predicted murein hydrolase (TIGR00659 family)
MIYSYLFLTLLVFLAARSFLSHVKSPFANPLLVSILFFIGLFSFTELNYESYAIANQPFIWLLEPAVVALAIPLFHQVSQIKKQFKAIMISCFVGVVSAMSTCLFIAILLTNDKVLLLSLLPKSVTSPIAMAITYETGGLASLSAAVVIAVGLLGALIGFSLLKFCKVMNPQAQGLAMGCSSHAIGTAKAMEIGHEQGAFSSLALVISGILTAVLAPLFAWLISIVV